MSLVEVIHARLDSHRPQRPNATKAEHRVLRQPDGTNPVVQPCRHPSAQRGVLVEVRVEQVQRHPPDIGPPYLDLELEVMDGHGDLERPPVRAADRYHRQTFGVTLDPILLLVAGRIGALVEVPVLVEEANADHRQPHVAGLLQDVPGEDAQTSRVDRQRRVRTPNSAHRNATGCSGWTGPTTGWRARSASRPARS